MLNIRAVSAVGCFGPLPWRETLHQAEKALIDLGQDPSLVAVAHRLARLIPSPEASRMAFWVLLGVLGSESEGHSRIDLKAPNWPEPLAQAMGPWEPIREALMGPALSLLVGTEGRPLILEGSWLSSQRLRAAEIRVAEAVKARASVSQRSAASVPEQVLTEPVKLNAEQRRAVSLALESPLALITGRPGTGKTSIVVAVLRALQRQDKPLPLDRILLAAPTGKAAQRMGEAIRKGLAQIAAPDALDQALLEDGPEPKTLHRTLGYHPALGGFRHNADNPLPADLVIVDEGSMIGLELLEGLLEALAPEARLVLLGDANQLPSVDPGAAFRELVASQGSAAVVLQESYRMDPRNPKGRHILLQAERINDPNRASELWGEEGIRQSSSLEEAFGQGGVCLTEPTPPKLRWMKAFLELWMQTRVWGGCDAKTWRDRVMEPIQAGRDGWRPEDRIRAGELLAHFDGFRLLCPINEGPDLSGVIPLNRHLHGLAMEAAQPYLEGHPRLLAGEPVVVLNNDPRRGLFNGDQGIVLPVRRGDGQPHLEAIFPRGHTLVGFPLPSIQDSLEHAYAMTVHKSQGSEFRALALVLPPAEHPALTREVLYTALTRAKEEVLLLGTPEAVDAACRRSVARRSGLLDRLGGLRRNRVPLDFNFNEKSDTDSEKTK